MRVKTGETATASVTVDVQYRCSSCGKENLTTQTVKGTAYTGTIMGVNLDRNLQSNAVRDLENNLGIITDPKNSERYRKAAFTCKCSHCSHAEPWAKMNYEFLDKIRVLCIFPMIFFGVISISVLDLKPITALQITVWLIAMLSIGTFIGIGIYKNNNTANMELQTKALPSESLPVVSIHARERHKAFNEQYGTFRRGAGAPAQNSAETVYDKWECKHCGTQNSMQYTQCKKCGKFK